MNPRIYIIDKSRNYRNIVTNCAEALNYSNIQSFENCEECLDHAKTPDVIILDYEQGTGNVNGLQFMKHYKLKFPETEFIFLSSNTNLEVAVESIRYGAKDYIIKSQVGLNRLVSRLDSVVQNKAIYRKQGSRLRASMFALLMFSAVFVTAIYLYNQHII